LVVEAVAAGAGGGDGTGGRGFQTRAAEAKPNPLPNAGATDCWVLQAAAGTTYAPSYSSTV